MARRFRARLVGAIGTALAHAWVHAAVDAAEGPTHPAPATPEYVDKLMQGAPLLPELADDGTAAADSTGAPRALRIETRAQSSSGTVGHESSAWISLRGALDTANYGSFSLDASARLRDQTAQQARGAASSFSLFQTAMPFEGGWAASNGLGVVQTLSPRVVGQQASFFVPTRLVQGASTQWRNEASGLSLQLSGGETGSFSSIGQGSFYGLGDRVVAFGLELQGTRSASPSLLPAGWSYGAVAATATGATGRDLPGLGSRSGEPAGSGLLQSLRWETPGAFAQGNLIASRNEDPVATSSAVSGAAQSSRVGAWFDGAWQSGDVTQRWGLHHLAPNLAWQGSALGGNSQGGYFRWSQVGLRTQIDAQLSSTQAVDAATGGAGLRQAGVSVRRYVDQQWGLGGVVQLSNGTASTSQASAYAELHRPAADVRLQAGLETSGGRVVVRRVSSDQAWVLPVGQRLSTSQAFNSTRAASQDSGGQSAGAYGNSLELAVTAGGDLSERLSLDLNARASLPVSSQVARVYNVGASGLWRLGQGWSLSAALGVSRSSGVAGTAPASPIPTLPGSFTSYVDPGNSARNAWIALRYDFQAGSAAVPIGAGARIGGGGGNIEGLVFLDDNGNGRLDALEARAANVSVLLDGRYTTRTDAQGRFEFQFVAPGPHRVTVASDTLPLPWAMPRTGEQRVEVAPRETTRLELGATRDRAGGTEE